MKRITSRTTAPWALLWALPWALLVALLSPLAVAGPGHDHGETTAPIAGAALPRFAATSEEVELVGILNGQQLTLYLDRFDDNSPINGAEIEVEIAGSPYKAARQGDGEYEVILKDPLKPGVMGVTAVVRAGELNDLLAAELDVPQDEHDHAHEFPWKAVFVGVGIGLLSLLLLGAAVWSGPRTTRA